MIRHATLIAGYDKEAWRGVLIEGPSGSGKSDLALRALAAGFSLIADDGATTFASGGRLYGRAPTAITGLIEVRGVGIVPRPTLAMARIVLMVHCASAPGEVERMPEPAFQTVAGVKLPVVTLWPFETSAMDKLICALEHLGAHRHREYEGAFAP